VKFFSSENINFQQQRFRLVVSREPRQRLFARLQEANERLHCLVSVNDQVVKAQLMRNRPGLPLSQNFDDYRQHAKCLYDALSKAASSGPSGSLCQCAGHVANLRLAANDCAIGPKTEFGVLMAGMVRETN
jgi:hypothetical protein